MKPGDVARLQGPGKALHPPIVSAKLVYVPAVQRIAPALAGRAESMGRNAGNHRRLQILDEIEEMGVGPDIDVVIVDEDGEVADDLDSALGAVDAQRAPLLEEGELNHTLNFQFALLLQTKPVKPAGLAPRQLFGPRAPGLAFTLLPHHVKQAKTFHPPPLLLLTNF